MLLGLRNLIVSGLGMVLVTVLFVSAAGAECAWLLWIKQEIDFIYPNKPPFFSTEWKLQKAVLSLQECEQLKKITWNIIVEQKTDTKYPGLESVRTVPNEMYIQNSSPLRNWLAGGRHRRSIVCQTQLIHADRLNK